MTRRNMLASLVGLLPMILLGMIACSGSSSTTTPPNDTHTFNSTITNYHSHTVTLNKTDVESPPMAGVAGDTSSSSGHTHSYALTQAELTTLMGGGSVTITTGDSSVTGLHNHDITFSKWF